MLKLDLNLLWTVVDVLILYVLLRKFLFKPIQNVLNQRQKKIEDDIAAAQTAGSGAWQKTEGKVKTSGGPTGSSRPVPLC